MKLDLMVFFQEIISSLQPTPPPKKIIIKDGDYVIDLHVGTHWRALFCRRSEVVYFDGFGVQHVT